MATDFQEVTKAKKIGFREEKSPASEHTEAGHSFRAVSYELFFREDDSRLLFVSIAILIIFIALSNIEIIVLEANGGCA